MGLGSEKCGVTMAHAGGRRRRERRQRKRGERTRSRGLAAALREREASERDGIRAGRDFISRGPVIPLADSAIPRTMRRKCRVKPNGARRRRHRPGALRRRPHRFVCRVAPFIRAPFSAPLDALDEK